jgi:DNA-directed RNA polymerase specialized sigma24 family protein
VDQGYNLEAAEQAEKALKRLNVFKLAVEYLYHRDQYDSDEMKFVKATESAWPELSDLQRDIVYMHTIQGFSFSGIADLKGMSPQAASQAFHRACKHFQTV